jgi:hypothetical protein
MNKSEAVALRAISREALAALGDGKIAYVKRMLSDDITRLYPEAPDLEPGVMFFALFGADGSPILLADSAQAAAATAWEQELETVSVH